MFLGTKLDGINGFIDFKYYFDIFKDAFLSEPTKILGEVYSFMKNNVSINSSKFT